MSKLFVAGCSLSDYTSVDTVYGELLSEKLGYDYIHEAAGCGSNWRIWRRITNHIINGNLTPTDLLIVQYTNNDRREFWSNHNGSYEPVGSGKQYLREMYKDGGDIIRYKIGSYSWQETPDEKVLHKVYEKFQSYSFNLEVFFTQHLMFQCMLKEFSIKTIFIPGYISKDDIKCIPHFENSLFNFERVWLDDSNHILNDAGHLNQKGHIELSNQLFEFIKTNFK